MDRKKLEKIFAILLIVGLVVLMAYLLLGRKQKALTPAPAPSKQVTLPAGNSAPTIGDAPVQVLDASVREVPTLARLFTERFGSYSTEANNANVDDVMSLVTPEFAATLRAAQPTPGQAKDFYGVSTRVLSATVTAHTDTTASVKLLTQRAETIGASDEVVRYQDAKLEAIKVGDTWKVSGIVWE